jgi:hypothetical protein
MGLCGSTLTPDEEVAVDVSKQIDKANFHDHQVRVCVSVHLVCICVSSAPPQENQRKIKLLLLGAGESGKSTVFKQMKLLYGSGAYLCPLEYLSCFALQWKGPQDLVMSC